MIIFTGKKHITFCLYSLVLYFAKDILTLQLNNNSLIFSLGALIGCLLPDVDHKNSIAGHVIPLWLIFKHGKQTHTIIANLLILIVAVGFNNLVGYGIAFGYFTHLFGDNIQGNNLKYLYYPFKRKKPLYRK